MKFEKNTTSVEDIDIKKIAKICIDAMLSNLFYDLGNDPEYYGVPRLDDKVFKDTNDCYKMIEDEVCNYISEKMEL